MLGAIAGDIIGSVYESRPVKTTAFPLFTHLSRFTDDTVLTIAVARAIMDGGDYGEYLRRYARRYPDAGYGGHFHRWMKDDRAGPYNSWGNGSAMRVSPVGLAFDSLEEVMQEAQKSAEVTHNHPEGIRGAQAVAATVFLAGKGEAKENIRLAITDMFGYNLDRTVEQIRPAYGFDVSCQGSVPEAIIVFLESGDFEDAVRKAVSLGGDSDTLACMAGGMAEAFSGHLPPEIESEARKRLPPEFLDTIDEFRSRYL